jgi:hypothetical protein
MLHVHSPARTLLTLIADARKRLRGVLYHAGDSRRPASAFGGAADWARVASETPLDRHS